MTSPFEVCTETKNKGGMAKIAETEIGVKARHLYTDGLLKKICE